MTVNMEPDGFCERCGIAADVRLVKYEFSDGGLSGSRWWCDSCLRDVFRLQFENTGACDRCGTVGDLREYEINGMSPDSRIRDMRRYWCYVCMNEMLTDARAQRKESHAEM